MPIKKLIKKKQVSKDQRTCEIPSLMAPPSLNVDKNMRTNLLRRFRRKIAKVKDTCNVSDVLDLDKLSTASEALAEAWQRYENSHQDVLVLLTEDKVSDEQTTFIEMEEAYEVAINEARKIIKGKRQTDDLVRALQPEQAVQLAAQRR